MRIPFLDLKAINQEIMDEITTASQRALQSGWYILGKENEAFEASLKEYLVGVQPGFVVGCNSGTDAIVLSLLAAGVVPGDEVITVSMTAIPTVSAICEVGAIPVFVDIDPDTWVMDVKNVVSALSPKTRAVVAVHLYGNMVDVFALQEALKQANRADVTIIEDVAQAHGATLRGKQAGTIGDFGSFSFYPSKNIGALGDGGAIFCKDEEHCRRLKMLHNYGQSSRYNATLLHGCNSRLDEVQAAILAVKLKYLPKWLEIKKHQMQLYRNALSALPIQFQQVTNCCTPGWHLCVVALPTQTERDLLISFLKEQNIEILIHYPIPNHRQIAFKHFCNDPLHITDNIAQRIVSLPLNTALAESTLNYIAEIIHRFCARKR